MFICFILFNKKEFYTISLNFFDKNFIENNEIESIRINAPELRLIFKSIEYDDF